MVVGVCDVLEDRSCDKLHFHRPKQLVLLFAASMENMCRQISPKLLHTIPTQEITQFIAGATVLKRLIEPQRISQSFGQMYRPSLEKQVIDPARHQDIPLADVEAEIETWRLLTSEE